MVLAFCVVSTLTASVKPRRHTLNVRQNDSTTITLHHIGDGEFSCYQTTDGYAVAKNEHGNYCYIESADMNSFRISSVVAHDADKRSDEEQAALKTMKTVYEVRKNYLTAQQETRGSGMRYVGLASEAPLSSIGSPHVPVILVEFQDKSFSAADTPEAVNEYFDKYCNGTGDGKNYTAAGNAGAVRDYFIAQSDSLFQPQFTVIGPIVLDKGYAYYGANEGWVKDKNIQEFFSEAIKKAFDTETDWTQFDNDNDGVIDIACFIYAGEGENASDDTNTIWPKETLKGGVINGISFGAYACNNETYEGKTDGIGTMCHELSHALGLPDLYDTNYAAYGMDYWDIMDSGNYCADGYCPCGYSAYEKDFMGWKPLVALESGQAQKVTLVPMSRGGCGYKIINPENPDEYYVVENRQNEKWDSMIGHSTTTSRHHGILVTHIDYSASYWKSNNVNTNTKHQRLTLIPADDELFSFMYVITDDDYEHFLESAAGDPYPGLRNVTELTGEKASVYTSSGKMGQPITDIAESEDGIITFVFCKDMTDDISDIYQEDAPFEIDGRYLTATDTEIYNAAGIRIVRLQGEKRKMKMEHGIYIVKTKKGLYKIAIK